MLKESVRDFSLNVPNEDIHKGYVELNHCTEIHGTLMQKLMSILTHRNARLHPDTRVYSAGFETVSRFSRGVKFVSILNYMHACLSVKFGFKKLLCFSITVYILVQ